jgi:hypothetical protein
MTLDPVLVWDEYRHLENDFLESLNFVPLTNEHYNVWSLYYGDLLLRTGSIIDSFFRRSIYSHKLNDAKNIADYRAMQDKSINFGTYQKLFGAYYNLSSKKIFDLRTYSPIIPFENWNNGRSPQWWDNYNQVKHDRFENRKLATMKTTLDALSGLFIINILHKETMPILVDLEVIKSGLAKGFLKELLNRKEPLNELDTVYAKSKLFGYVFESEKFPDNDAEKQRILSPFYPGY